MNHTYRLVWNARSQRHVPAPECARGQGKSAAGKALRPAALVLATILAWPVGAESLPPLSPTALPSGGQVVAGQASIGQSGTVLTVNQGSDKAILQWQGFDIGSQARVNFLQPGSHAVALNRVVAGEASRIHGQLSANGQVWLVNPQGVVFGAGSRVDVGGLVASTLDIRNEDFLAGRMVFQRGTATGSIQNLGEIKAADGGLVALLAPQVSNDGILSARLGKVVLAGGDRVTLDAGVDGHLQVATDPATVQTLIDNRQLIVADGGQVIMTGKAADTLAGAVVANNGTVRANAVAERNGRILLVADHLVQQGELLATGPQQGGEIELRARGVSYLDGRIDVSSADGQAGRIQLHTGKLEGMADATLAADGAQGGQIRVEARGMAAFSSTLSAKGRSQGGRIEVSGDSVVLLGAMVDASASGGQGGTIHLGGGWQGSGDLPQARELIVGVGSTVQATGQQGGEAVLWSTASTGHHGRVDVQGQQQGGRIEVSSKEGAVSLRGELAAGPGGTVLLDPKNLVVTDSPPDSLTFARKVVSGSLGGMPTLADGDGFGHALALDGDRLAVGAAADDTGGTDRGAVHLFTGVGSNFSGLSWRKKLASSTGATSMPALSNNDRFGHALALNGDRLAVGAFGDDTGGADRGAVHLFAGVGSDFSGLSWQKKLSSSAGATNMPALANTDQFGIALALDGDRLVVGANGDDTGGTNRGAVHLFTGVGSNFSGLTWQKKLAHSAGAAGMPALNNDNGFGASVALDGDRLAVGSFYDDTGGPDRGAVHLFNGVGSDFSGLAWQKKLSSSSGATGMPVLADYDQFGYALALDGDRLAVSAIWDDTGGADRGAVHLFTGVGSDFSGLTWQKKLSSSAGATGMPALADADQFGYGLALDGDRLAVGAIGDDTGGSNRGGVHLFAAVGSDFSGLTWQKKLASGTGTTATPALASADQFGTAVALDGDRLAVGAVLDDTGGTSRGAVHLFTGVGSDFSGLTWRKKLASSTGAIAMPALANSDQFGIAVALDGDRLAVGASGDDTGGNARGAVHLFTGVGSDFSGLTWQKKLAHSAGATNMSTLADGDSFGHALALDGDRLAVGAYADDTGGATRGAVHLFNGVGSDFSGLTWQKKLASNSGATGMPALVDFDAFGYGVALDGDRLAVGAYRDDTGGIDRGAVHLFTGVGSDFSGLTWQKKLASSSGATSMPALTNSDVFGVGLALDGDRLAVGAHLDDTGGASRGAVHLFSGVGSNFSGLTWQKKLASSSGATGMPALVNGEQFGRSVALDGDRLVVGAWLDDSVGIDRGAVYLFTGLSTTITPSQAIFSGGVNPTSYVTPGSLAALLNAGTAITLQASNDITVNSAITANNAAGTGGHLTLQAGRQVTVNAAISSDDGALTLIANDKLANGVVNADRESGPGGIAVNAALNTGTGNLRLEVRDGAGKTHTTAGDIALGANLSAGTITALNQGGAGVKLAAGTTLTASATGDALTLAGATFTNNAGANALQTPNGRRLVWSSTPSNDTRGGLSYDFKQYAATYGSTAVASTSGHGFLYTLAPTLTAGLTGATSKTYDASTSATLSQANYTASGAVDGDSVTLSASGSYDTAAAGTGKTVNASGIQVSASNGSARVYGYGVNSTASAAIGTITPKALTVYANDASKTFDGIPYSGGNGVSYSGFAGSDNAAVLGGTLRYGGSSQGASLVGRYGITASGLSSTNYSLSYVDGALVIAASNALASNDTQASQRADTPSSAEVWRVEHPLQPAAVPPVLLTSARPGTPASGMPFLTLKPGFIPTEE